MKYFLSTALFILSTLSSSAFASDPSLNKTEIDLFNELPSFLSKDQKIKHMQAFRVCAAQALVLTEFLDANYLQKLHTLPPAERGKDCWNYLHRKYLDIANQLNLDVFMNGFAYMN
jgi:hypothetical protein